MPTGEKPTNRGKSKFRPRARLIRAIGEDLISSSTIALVELIKNAYDADATRVVVSFEPPLEPGEGQIVVEDNGHGMTLSVVQSGWLEPATVTKRDQPISPGGRRVTGEKGLGRFAAARLARRMLLESISASAMRRVEASFDWDEFRDESRFLDQIECEWAEFRVEPRTPPGTTLKLIELRDEWDRKAFESLRSELARLVAKPPDGSGFAIELRLPEELEEYGGEISPPPVLGRPHYALKGEVSAEGKITGELSVKGETSRIDEHLQLEHGRHPACGPYTFEFSAWDRDELKDLASDLGSTVRSLRRDLNDASGVSIYRDGFRVLPYGSATDDWLSLDSRRVNNPTMRLSNNQVVGALHISADGNPDLRDQTNREGLIESQGLVDLRDSVIELLALIESKRYAARRAQPSHEEREDRGLFSEIEIDAIRESFARKYPADSDFLAFLDNRAAELERSVERVQEVVSRYRRLSTLGRLVDVILHDGRTPISAIGNEVRLATRTLEGAGELGEVKEKVKRHLEVMSRQVAVLSHLFKRIAPFGGRKRGRPANVDLEQLVSDTFEIQRRELEEMGVKVSLPESSTPVSLDAAEMQQIFLNLLDNALYWLRQVAPDKRAISVEVEQSETEVRVIFADSGPGVPEGMQESIFDPYFSSKPHGVGLGLTIAGEIAAEYGGELELISSRLLPGAAFRVTLRRRVGRSGEGS